METYSNLMPQFFVPYLGHQYFKIEFFIKIVIIRSILKLRAGYQFVIDALIINLTHIEK